MAHILRRLSDDFVRQITEWYSEIGIKAPPRTHSTMLLLDRGGPMGVTKISAVLRQSHPLVLTWIRQLKDLGFVESRDDPGDARRSIVSLTLRGKADLRLHKQADRIAAQAFESLMREADAPIFESLWRMEEINRGRPFLKRLRDEMEQTSLDP
jgi:DNA-binding MarR family transcriptional regulator